MIIEKMLQNYNVNSLDEKKNAIKEIVQEILLASLSQTEFFNSIAFYGGTALRIFYGLDRFSEDLDFTLLVPDERFDLSVFFDEIVRVVETFGLKFDVSLKEKNHESAFKSSFLKGNTREQFLVFYPTNSGERLVPANEKIQIKFEVDTNPPLYANTELKYRLLPFPYQVRVYD